MTELKNLITDNIDIWTSAIKKRSATGRGSSKKIELTGVKKLRELILELAIRGKLVPQNPDEEPASLLLNQLAEEKVQLIADKEIKNQKVLPLVLDEEKEFELPPNWEWCRLQYLVTLLGDGLHGTPNYDDSGAFFFVNGNNLNSGVINIKPETKRVNEEEYNKYKKNLNSRTVFVSINGTLGNVAFYNDEPIILGKSACYFNLGSNLSKLYVKRVIESPYFIEYAFAKASGSTIKNLGLKAMNNFPIALPPIGEQHRIVLKVDELMGLCDQLEQQTEQSISAHQTLVQVLLKTLNASVDAQEFSQNWKRIAEHFDTLFTTEYSIEQLKQTILQLAAMGKLVSQDASNEPASELLKRIAFEKEQLIADKKLKKGVSTDNIIKENCEWNTPVNWANAELQNLFKFIDYRGKNPAKSEFGKRIITAKNIKNGFIKNEPVEYISEELYKSWMIRGLPKSGDILFVTEGHTMGFVTAVNLDYEFALAQRTICFQPFININTKFFLYVCMSQQFQRILVDNQTGSAAGGIKASKLKRIPLPIPPFDEQARIVEKVEQLMLICEQLKSQIINRQTTKVDLAEALVKQGLSH